jgi:hypothetical protein
LAKGDHEGVECCQSTADVFGCDFTWCEKIKSIELVDSLFSVCV